MRAMRRVFFPAADAEPIPARFSRLPTPFASPNASDFTISRSPSPSSPDEYISNGDGSDADDQNAIRSSEVSLRPGIRSPSHVFAPSQNARGPGSSDEDSVQDTQSSVVTVAAAGAEGERANMGMNDTGVEAIEGDGISSAEEGDDEGDGGREELSMGADVDVDFMEECLEEWRGRGGNERWRVWKL